MTPAPGSAVSRHLHWVFLQGFLFSGAVLGPLVVEDFRQMSVPMQAFQVLLAAWLLFALGRNLVRLWRAPAAEDRRSHAIWLAVLGGLFLLASSGPLLESERWSRKPEGVMALLLGANLLALAVRQSVRLRGRQQRSQHAV